MNLEFLNTEQLARRWNLSSSTLASWRQQGLGCKHRTVSGVVVYSLLDVENYENFHWYIKPSK